MSNMPLLLVNKHPFRAVLFRLFRGPNRIADLGDMADAVGVSEKTAERWTNGASEPSGAELMLITLAFPDAEAAIAQVQYPDKVLVPQNANPAEVLRTAAAAMVKAAEAIEGNG